MSQPTLLICTKRRRHSPSCHARGAEVVATQLEPLLQHHYPQVTMERIACLGHCQHGPNLRLVPNGPLLHHITETELPRLLELMAHWLQQQP
ncbi:(2Fe-2S) ferredoxin domain-containing protein [Ectothiorhodospiraceae bacterium BW-2]|nr:(2Fe-2S) ferredoxin domain-containing protein [Ectothiorhodospiraceae bacterium BW-2]